MTSRTQRRKERQQRRYKPWFHQYEVEYLIRQAYPGCPEFAVVYFATYVCNEPKNWKGYTIEMAVEHVMQCELRHQMTDYDQLMLEGVRPSEARRRVQPRVDAMIAIWKKLDKAALATADVISFAKQLLTEDHRVLAILSKDG